MAIREHLLGPDDLLVATSAHNLGTLHFSKGEYEQAQGLLERALAIREKNLRPDHPLLAQTLNNLAIVHTEKGELAQARELPVRRTQNWLVLDGIAKASLSEGNVALARQLYRRLLFIREQAFRKNNAAVTESMIGLANCDRKEAHTAQAEATFERALALCRTPEGKYIPAATDILDDYLAMLRATHQDGIARALDQRTAVD